MEDRLGHFELRAGSFKAASKAGLNAVRDSKERSCNELINFPIIPKYILTNGSFIRFRG